MSSSTSRRTGGPNRRRVSSFSIAEEVLGVVLLDLDVLVAGDPEGRVLVHLHPGEQLVEVGGDDVLEWDEPHRMRRVVAPARRDQAGERRGTLIRAKCSLPVLGLTRVTARFSESPEM